MPKCAGVRTHMWESISDVASDSDCGAASSDEVSPQVKRSSKGGAPAVLLSMLQSDSESESEQEVNPNRDLKSRSVQKREPLQISFKPAEVVSSVSHVVSKLPPPEAAPR